MCGRYLIDLPVDQIARIFGVDPPLPNYPPRYNVAPTQPVLAIRFNPATRTRRLDTLRWGLVPHWAKDLASGARRINARAETLAETPAFREAFARRRCLIPATGFYEWQRSDVGKQPYAIVPREAPLFALAGLWENWRDPASGEWIRSCAIVTRPAEALLAPVHERMPAILPPEAWAAWLGEAPAPAEMLRALLLQRVPEERLRAYPVSPRVNNVRNDDSGLRDPVMAAGGLAV